MIRRDYVIELNDSMMGLAPDHWRDDSAVLRDLVVDRMDAIYVKDDVPRPVFLQNENFDRYGLHASSSPLPFSVCIRIAEQHDLQTNCFSHFFFFSFCFLFFSFLLFTYSKPAREYRGERPSVTRRRRKVIERETEEDDEGGHREEQVKRAKPSYQVPWWCTIL